MGEDTIKKRLYFFCHLLIELGKSSVVFERALRAISIYDCDGVFLKRDELMNICELAVGIFLKG